MNQFPRELWSSLPSERLAKAKSLDVNIATEIADKCARAVPEKHKNGLPFGMPTSVNPFIVLIGVSPGAGEEKDQYSYGKPTVGVPHHGFMWDVPYWQKARILCTEIVKSFSPELSDDECLSVSGSLNLGTKQQGVASEMALESEIVKWVPDFITKYLKLKIVVCFGIKSLLKHDLL